MYEKTAIKVKSYNRSYNKLFVLLDIEANSIEKSIFLVNSFKFPDKTETNKMSSGLNVT